MSSRSHFWLWIVLSAILFFGMPLFISYDSSINRIETERQSASMVFGKDRVNGIVTRSNLVYNALFVETGIAGGLESQYIESAEEGGDPLSKSVSNLSIQSNSYILSLLTNVYGIIFRALLVWEWLALIGLFLGACFVDGLVQRRIKQESFGFNSPVRFSLAVHTLILISAVPVLYLLAPLAVSPWFMVIWALAIALPISIAVSNAVRTN